MVIWKNIERILRNQKLTLKEMASLTSTIAKTGKKIPSNPTLALSSPVNPKPSEGTQKMEKPPATPTLQTVQSSLVLIQETMLAMQEKLLNSHSELKTDIQALDTKMIEIQTAIAKNENRIQNAEQRIEKTEKKLDTVDQTLSLQHKETEDALAQLEMDRAAFYLRFQNIPEDREENLGEKMADLIAVALQQDKQDIVKEIDEAYRVQTNYVRRNRLPREVHLRFARKRVRDIVYNAAREEQIIYDGKEVNVLKQVPRRVREKRRSYRFLTSQLNKRNITFRWLLPEGMLVSWLGRKIKIDSLGTAQDFFEQLKETEEEQASKEDIEATNTGEDTSQEQSTREDIDDEKKKEDTEETGKKIRPVRAVTLKANRN